ncbi:30S ribosomal protein S14 [Methanomicrobiaceae archaeon CYW5]|uniref:30S ribosomal protein S14 n=1 Tax=Methanovulcanius yangii TaxID=1789227 RepID=UPI0029CA4F91|nr:30S ribosomal protein S14 [Methanovulcanius yangii]MBT8508016.1 30S ribosomal protein S14 [Methanovulcanius yangii]
MSEQQKQNKEQDTTKSGRGANECLICGRKQGLVRRHNIMLCRQCFRENAAKIGFKKMN